MEDAGDLMQVWLSDLALSHGNLFDDAASASNVQFEQRDIALSTIRHLLESYDEPHRRYHNTAHVHAVVRRVTTLASLAYHPANIHPPDVRLAAWYHDVIYDPRSSSNEADSAQRATSELSELGLDQTRIERIAELINMTQHHHPEGRDAAVLADADLWTLGGSSVEYFAYGALIRQEYAHVNEEQWRSGRSNFIETFLQRNHIFHTEIGQREREQQARENLAAELNTLTRFA